MYPDFDKLKTQPKTISKAELKENKKSNVFFFNCWGGVFEPRENIELVAKEMNKEMVFDYVRMLAYFK